MTNPLHIKIEYDEAVYAKKDILSSEINALNLAKHMKRYNELRIMELKLKSKLHRNLRSVLAKIRNLHKSLPKPHLEDLEKTEETPEEKKSKKKKQKENLKVDEELKKIQKKLASLQQ